MTSVSEVFGAVAMRRWRRVSRPILYLAEMWSSVVDGALQFSSEDLLAVLMSDLLMTRMTVWSFVKGRSGKGMPDSVMSRTIAARLTAARERLMPSCSI